MKDTITDRTRQELRKLPGVDKLMKEKRIQDLLAEHGHDLTVTAIQETLAALREDILHNGPCPTCGDIPAVVAETLAKLSRPSLHPVINAAGVIIHTNLGRAPLSQAAREAIHQTSAYCNLEYDLPAGERGSRYIHAEELLCRLTGAEAALVVNNDAAAVLLVLTALAKGQEVIISRGQLVEIGGGFRIPEVMAQSGARLVEVGTTNRTYLQDYEGAITPETALLLRVHSSNFRLVGFVHEAPLADLVALAHRRNLVAVDDLGSGALLDTTLFGLSHEPTIQESLASGVDLVCVSGDKLLGGPQAGIILGKAALVTVLKRHPLTRALRVSKMILAGLQATLLHYLKNEATARVPVWQMISAPAATVEARAAALAAFLRGIGVVADVVQAYSAVGGGSLPGEMLATPVVAIHVEAPDNLAKRLRLGSPPVIGRIEAEALVLDLRTVLPAEEETLRQALQAALARNES